MAPVRLRPFSVLASAAAVANCLRCREGRHGDCVGWLERRRSGDGVAAAAVMASGRCRSWAATICCHNAWMLRAVASATIQCPASSNAVRAASGSRRTCCRAWSSVCRQVMTCSGPCRRECRSMSSIRSARRPCVDAMAGSRPSSKKIPTAGKKPRIKFRIPRASSTPQAIRCRSGALGERFQARRQSAAQASGGRPAELHGFAPETMRC